MFLGFELGWSILRDDIMVVLRELDWVRKVVNDERVWFFGVFVKFVERDGDYEKC